MLHLGGIHKLRRHMKGGGGRVQQMPIFAYVNHIYAEILTFWKNRNMPTKTGGRSPNAYVCLQEGLGS